MKKPILILSLLLSAVLLMHAAQKRNRDSELSRRLTTFNAMVRELQENYVDTLPLQRTFEAATEAFLSQIDPYTEYYPASEREAFKTMTTGRYGGVGSYIMMRPDSSVYFSGPYEGSPAVKAGIRTGDRILRVDTVDVSRAGSERVSTLLKGEPGTKVQVQIARPYAGPDSLLTFTLQREKLSLPSVPYAGMADPEIGYIKLTSYMEDSPREVSEALESLMKNPKLKGLVLDLRGNGGGLVESAVDIVGLFVPKGTEVLRMKGRTAASQRIYRTTHKPIAPDLPLVVLIDGASASASEITAGALQDLDRALLIGTRSFGKGLVQSTRPMPYDGLLKVTTAKYYIPSGRLIQALDYSHRNPDGSVAAVPDSLARSFLTKGGRTVKDGGGLKPDIEVKWDTPVPLTVALMRENAIFDFGTRYAASHDSIPSPEAFEVTDDIYAQFKQSIDPQTLKYDTRSEKLLSDLRSAAEKEGYMKDTLTLQTLEALKPLLAHDLERDLDIHRPQISQYIAYDLLGRYYFNRGEIIYELLHDDEAMEQALPLLHDRARYKSLLSPQKK